MADSRPEAPATTPAENPTPATGSQPEGQQPASGPERPEPRGRQANRPRRGGSNSRPAESGQTGNAARPAEQPAAPAAPATTTTPTAPETPAPAATPAPAESRPATPPPPPPPPGEPRDHDPFHRNVVNTEVDRETVPLEPSVNLEREANRTRNEDINDLIEDIRTLDEQGRSVWEKDQREDRLRERYGKPSVMRDVKAWLSGENDLVYNKQTGTVEYRYGTEVIRRLAHIGINTAETAGIMAMLGLVTGGAAVVVAPALIGSTLGRGFAEAWQGISGKERGMREDIVIARERYYQKAQELANRIPPTEPANWDELNVRERSEYIAKRNAAIRSLVDFVHASEQNGVKLIHKGRERQGLADIWRRRREAGGQPFVDSEVFGQPVEVGDRSQGEPVGPTDKGGPSLNRGSEVYQPSPDAPSKDTLDDMEKEFQKFRRKWDLIKAGCAMVGGLAGSAEAILAAKKKAVVQLTQKLDAGKAVKLDIDGNWIWHNVQRMGEGFRNTWELQDQFVFHYKNTIEALKAAAHGVQMLPGGDFGLHALNETALRIAQAIDKQAWLEALRYTGIPAIGAIAAKYIWRKGTTEAAQKNFEEERGQMKQEEEVLRRRRQPESRIEQLKSDAHKEGKVFPAEGQIWRYVIDAGEPGNPDKKALWGYLQIIKVIESPDNVYVQFVRKDPRDPDDTIEEMSADELIYASGFKQITTSENELRVSTPRVGEQQPSGQVNITGNLAPSGDQLAERRPEASMPADDEEISAEQLGDDEKPEVVQPAELQEIKEKELVKLKVGETYEAKLTAPVEKNAANVEINGTKFRLHFKVDLNSARFPRGSIIDFKVLEEPRERGKNPAFVEAELGPKAKAKEINQSAGDKLEDILTGKEEPKAVASEPIIEAAKNPFDAKNIWVVRRQKNKGEVTDTTIGAAELGKPDARIRLVKLDPKQEYQITRFADGDDGRARVLIEPKGEGVNLVADIEEVKIGFELKAIRDCADSRVKSQAEDTLVKAVEGEAAKSFETKGEETGPESEANSENAEFPIIGEYTIYRPDATPLLVKPGDVILDSKPGDRHEVAQIRTGDDGREVYFINGAGDAIPLSKMDSANVKIEGQEK